MILFVLLLVLKLKVFKKKRTDTSSVGSRDSDRRTPTENTDTSLYRDNDKENLVANTEGKFLLNRLW